MNRWKTVAIAEAALLVAAGIALLDSHKHDPGRFRLISAGIALDTETGRFCKAFAKPKFDPNAPYQSVPTPAFDQPNSNHQNDPPYCEDIR
jgi:hypothetical protein